MINGLHIGRRVMMLHEIAGMLIGSEGKVAVACRTPGDAVALMLDLRTLLESLGAPPNLPDNRLQFIFPRCPE